MQLCGFDFSCYSETSAEHLQPRIFSSGEVLLDRNHHKCSMTPLGTVKSLRLDSGLALFLSAVPGFWQRDLELVIHLGDSLGATL